jgi:hypothetical protein
MAYSAAKWIAHVRGLDESAIDALAQRTAGHYRVGYEGYENIINQADVIRIADWYAGEFTPPTDSSHDVPHVENTAGEFRLQDLLD